MAEVTVYNFWHYNGSTDESRLSPTKRTAEAIERMSMKVALDTAEKVDESELDAEGRYHLRPHGSA